MDCNCPVIDHGPSLASTCGGAPFLVFMGLLEQFIRRQCDIEDPCGQIHSKENPDDEYDFIVAGGGPAGSVVANRLSEIPHWKVLVVEAGGNEPTGSQVPSTSFNFIGSSIDWNYKTEPEERACLGSKEKRCSWPRGKVIGGSSVFNGMLYFRGSRKDFNDWENLGNVGWSYEDVLPYFIKSENNLQPDLVDLRYHGVGGYWPVGQFPYRPPMAEDILEGAKELGQHVRDVNGEYHEGFTIAQTTSRNGVRFSGARSFLRPVKDRFNLHIMLNTTVARVLVDLAEKRAYGVEIIRSDGQKLIIHAKKEVIVCGGTVNSPQMLLLSGIGPKDDLAKANVPVVHHLPGVGKNLHNHVAYRLNFFINEAATTDLNWATATEYLLYRNGLMSSTGLSQVVGFIKTKFADLKEDHPDIQLLFAGYLANCAKTGVVGEPSGETKDGVPPRRSVTFIPKLLHPKSRGYITLKDNDPLSHPKIFGNYFADPMDMATLVEGLKFALKLSKTKALRKYGIELDQTPVKGCEDHNFGTDEYWECAIQTDTLPENHPAGSCKMGPETDPDAVVDPELRVHGVTNLRVMDASVMPRVNSGNACSPVVMIAEKGCDLIKRTWLDE